MGRANNKTAQTAPSRGNDLIKLYGVNSNIDLSLLNELTNNPAIELKSLNSIKDLFGKRFQESLDHFEQIGIYLNSPWSSQAYRLDEDLKPLLTIMAASKGRMDFKVEWFRISQMYLDDCEKYLDSDNQIIYNELKEWYALSKRNRNYLSEEIAGRLSKFGEELKDDLNEIPKISSWFAYADSYPEAIESQLHTAVAQFHTLLIKKEVPELDPMGALVKATKHLNDSLRDCLLSVTTPDGPTQL